MTTISLPAIGVEMGRCPSWLDVMVPAVGLTVLHLASLLRQPFLIISVTGVPVVPLLPVLPPRVRLPNWNHPGGVAPDSEPRKVDLLVPQIRRMFGPREASLYPVDLPMSLVVDSAVDVEI